MKIYVSGPMSNYPYFNFPTFNQVTKLFRGKGHEVFNPAERDVAQYGDDFWKSNLTGSIEEASKKYKFSLREALAEDTAYICKEAEAIVMLPGWEKSSGARAEHALAVALGLTILYGV